MQTFYNYVMQGKNTKQEKTLWPYFPFIILFQI